MTTFFKNDCKMKVMTPDLWGDGGGSSPSTSWSEERSHLRKKVFELEQEIGRNRVARKWYLIVVVLLYVGLLASFSLNVSLLLRKPPPRHPHHDKFSESSVTLSSQVGESTETTQPPESLNQGFAYTTPCLVAVPCESGQFYDCTYGECRSCPQGTYQPQWGQTSCWPCPSNTTTDQTGSSLLTSCKRHDCPFYTREGVGIMESPNYPGDYPLGVTCRWRVRPGHTKRVLLILPQLSLPTDCSASFTIRHQANTIFSSCTSRPHPLILTGHSNNLWVEFTTSSLTPALGFQLTALSVEEELGYLVDAVVNSGEISSFDEEGGQSTLSQDDKLLLSRLLLLLNPTYPATYEGKSQTNPNRRRKPVIEVLEDNSSHN